MAFFKKLINILSGEATSATAPEEKEFQRAFPEPDYNAYVYIRDGAGPYKVSLPKGIKNKFSKISSKYAQSFADFNVTSKQSPNERNYRATFNTLKALFRLVMKEWSNKYEFPYDENKLVQMTLSLKSAGFDEDQMNVFYGILEMENKYLNNEEPVIEYDILVHFVSLGLVVNMFKKTMDDVKASDVAVSFKAKKAKMINYKEDSIKSAQENVQSVTDTGNAEKAFRLTCPGYSFREMENELVSDVGSISEKYPDLFLNISDAEEFFEAGKYDAALNSVRKVIEVITVNLCKRYSIDHKDMNLVDRIDKIVSISGLSDAHKDILHGARRLGNIGSHYSDTEGATQNNALEALDLAKKATEFFENIVTGGKQRKNIPMYDPDYYAPTRRHYGRWSKCFLRQDFMMNRDFVLLKRRADSGDISAMLDIANGFLASKISWDVQTSLINAQKSPVYDLYPNRFDARYYYWILKACSKAYDDWSSGKAIPLTYIATALIEAIKFILFYHNAVSHLKTHLNAGWNSGSSRDGKFISVSDYNKKMNISQYTYTEKLFGGKMDCSAEQIQKYALMFISLMNEFPKKENGENIVASVHMNFDAELAKRCVYMYYQPKANNSKINLVPELLLEKNDNEISFAEVYARDPGLKNIDAIIEYKKIFVRSIVP